MRMACRVIGEVGHPLRRPRIVLALTVVAAVAQFVASAFTGS